MRERFRFEREIQDLGIAEESSYRDFQSFNPADTASQLEPIFRESFSFKQKGAKKRTLYGARLSGKVTVEMLSDSDFTDEWKREVKRRGDALEKQVLKFAPELVRDELLRYYKTIGEKFPDRLNVIDETTKLDADESAVLFGMIKALWLVKAEDEIKKLEGFYSSIADKVVLKESTANIAVLAHEMAHAYADRSWHDFMTIMALRKMKNVNELDEGLTTRIERIVVNAWIKKQKDKKLKAPPAAYDAKYTKIADEFVKALKEKTVYESYFAGEVNFTDNAKPEDSLELGRSKKKWSWKWR